MALSGGPRFQPNFDYPLTIRNGLGVTGFFPPSGFDVANSAKVSGSTLFNTFKVLRFYTDLQSNGGETYAGVDRTKTPYTCTNPKFSPPGNASWRLDEFYQNLKSENIITIISPQGAFYNQNLRVNTSLRKHPPIDGGDGGNYGSETYNGDDPFDPDSYTAYADLMEQFALRYGPVVSKGGRARVYTDPGSPFDSSILYNGLNHVLYIQCGNEDNFPWHQGPVVMDWDGATETGNGPAMSAAKFYACYRAIRRSCPYVRIITGSILSATFSWYTNFMTAFDGYWQQDNPGIPPPRDFYLSWHRYHRKGGQGQTQGADEGESPEIANNYALGKGFDDIVEQNGLLGHMCTETGWNDNPDYSDTDARKQRAVSQHGFTLGESAALMVIRNHLIYASLPNYIMTANYSHKDNREGEPYTYMGFQYERKNNQSDEQLAHPDGTTNGEAGWQIGQLTKPKPALIFIDGFFNQWGDWSVVTGSYVTSSTNLQYSFDSITPDSSITGSILLKITGSNANPEQLFTITFTSSADVDVPNQRVYLQPSIDYTDGDSTSIANAIIYSINVSASQYLTASLNGSQILITGSSDLTGVTIHTSSTEAHPCTFTIPSMSFNNTGSFSGKVYSVDVSKDNVTKTLKWTDRSLVVSESIVYTPCPTSYD